MVTTLLDNAPPGTEELQEEAKGEGLLAVYREQITAEFTPLIQTIGFFFSRFFIIFLLG